MRSGRKIGNASRASLLRLGAAALAAALLAPIDAAAASYQVLYNFCSQSGCADRVFPSASLIIDGAGNLYGTTSEGGTGGAGVVFKLAPDGTETVRAIGANDPRAKAVEDGLGPVGG